MTALKGPAAASSATTGQGRTRLRRGLRLALCLLALSLAATAATALAENVHVSATADPEQSATHARQQALGRALADAVYKEALRLVPAPLAPARADALRASLSPRAIDFVQSYQDANPAPAQPDSTQPQSGSGANVGAAPAIAVEASPTLPAQPAPPAQPVTTPSAGVAAAHASNTFEFDVNVRRAALRAQLERLGMLAGARHPGVYSLRLGKGVKEKDVAALGQADVLLGLKRVRQTQPAPSQKPESGQGVEVSLERLPQGYYKAVLRQGDIVIAADASTLPDLWLDVWGRYFADSRMQPGPGAQVLVISGFATVDAVQDFVRVLAGWDEAVQDPSLAGLDLDADGVSARFTCRVVNQQALDAHLRTALAERKLTLAPQPAPPQPGATPESQAGVPAP